LVLLFSAASTNLAFLALISCPSSVWLATDEDREGEAIAWHLCEVLKLDPKTTKRITFHEITKSAIEEAIKHPRTVDMKLVEAQQARQILDRIVGFELSPVVWQKVPGGKSAGRVQSPAVRLLVEREHEIEAFAGSSQFKVTAIFAAGKQELKAELKQRFDSEDAARAFLESLAGAAFTVTDISTSPSSRNPAAPFTTSTLQQEANSKLGMGSRATMASAQKLYQEGRITYMRTDSVNLSSQAIAASADYIKRLYGIEYSHVRKFKTKSAGAQEAHEAIRPTDITRESVSGSDYDQRLYDLIRRRTLASQMAPAKLENTTITISINNGEEKQNNSSKTNDKLVFEAKGQVVLFDGFLRVYGGGKDDTILPTVKSGEQLQRHSVEARQVFARPPARYTEGTLVKKLEELGIGRPSTYATIMNTIQTRGYAEKGDSEGIPRDVILLQLIDNKVEREIIQEKTGSNKGKLVPTPAGELISGFLTDHFDRVVDYGFTADVEKDFDDIAGDRLARNTMLEKFYAPFHALIEQSGNIDRRTVGANREVGIDPKSGKPIIARFGRFGPMLQLGSSDDKADKPQFAPLPKGAKIETVTLEQALHAFELPRLVGQTEDGQDIKANVGRFGPYIQIGKLYVSLKDIDPREVTQEQARELYAAKLKAEAEKNIADFGDGIKVLNGRFGPYVTDGSKNAKIPKDTDPKTITRDQAVELLANAPQKRSARRQIRRKK
jgi:DNA topoisomerase I